MPKRKVDPDDWMNNPEPEPETAKKSTVETVVNRRTLQALTGWLARDVDKMIDRGMPVIKQEGRSDWLRFDVPAVVAWALMDALREYDPGSTADNKRRASAALAATKELDLSERKGDLIRMATLRSVIPAAMNEQRERLIVIADRLDAPQEVREAFRDEVKRVINETAIPAEWISEP